MDYKVNAYRYHTLKTEVLNQPFKSSASDNTL